jgi:AraC-like DNA-binding protein
MPRKKPTSTQEILTQIIEKAHHWDENSSSVLPNLEIYNSYETGPKLGAVYDPVVCLILQGSKETSIGEQHVKLEQGDALLVSHQLPVVSRIVKASQDAPYLALLFSLDFQLVRSLYDLIDGTPELDAQARSLSAAPAEASWLMPLLDYMELQENPLDAKVLGDSISRQVHYRLILSPIGKMLRKLIVVNSHASKVAHAIEHIRSTYQTNLSVAELAIVAGMSTSSFYTHFKEVTGTTPLQFQKDLRLIEAQSLLTHGSAQVSDVAFNVGYNSPNQFSRDYRKKFGRPPSDDRVG